MLFIYRYEEQTAQPGHYCLGGEERGNIAFSTQRQPKEFCFCQFVRKYLLIG